MDYDYIYCYSDEFENTTILWSVWFVAVQQQDLSFAHDHLLFGGCQVMNGGVDASLSPQRLQSYVKIRILSLAYNGQQHHIYGRDLCLPLLARRVVWCYNGDTVV